MTGYSSFAGRGRGRGGRGGGKPSSASSSSQPQAATSATVSGPPDSKRIKSHDAFDPYSLDNLLSSWYSNQGSILRGTSNAGGPAQTGDANKKSPAQYPFASVSDLERTGIFGSTGVRPSQIEEILRDDPNLPETPSKTNKATVEQLQKLMADGLESEELLQKFKDQSEKARGGMTTEQRKQALRKEVLPWIEVGLNYEGPKRPGLFLDDGTRNPERPPKGSGSGPPPDANPAGPAATTTKNGGPKAINPSSSNKNKASKEKEENKKSSTLPGPTSTNRPGNGKSSSSNGPNSPDGPKLPRPKGIEKSPLGTQPPLSADDFDVSNPGPSTGTRPSHSGPRIQTSSETGRAGWQARDDLFNAEVMDAAGLTYALGHEDADTLPEFPSWIDYNTENWE